MTLRARVTAAAAAALCLLASGSRPPIGAQPVTRPNVLFVLIDDMGWRDTGVYGSDFHDTPHIDRLAAEGARFTQFYAASGVCSPTRASIMTGKAPARVRITDWIGGNDAGAMLPALYERSLPLSEFTVGEAFRAAGYATGYIGKWHLGVDQAMPSRQGFDFTRAVNHAGQPGSHLAPFTSASRPETNVPELEDAATGEYLTDRLTTEAVRFIQSGRTQPFFLMLSHYAVHTPLEAKPALLAKYTERRDRMAAARAGAPSLLAEGTRSTTKQHQEHAAYATMVESVDESMGRLLHTLDSLGIARNTIVVFMSDNGGLSTLLGSARNMPTSNTPLRAGKGWLYEGGIRAPLIVRWPGAIAPGRVVETPTISTDLYPTLLQLAGLPARGTQTLDGTSVAPLLRGTGPVTTRALHWHFPHYHGSGSTPSGAIRDGSLKLVEWLESGQVELYDLATDPGERHDLAAARPRDAAALRAALARWRTRVGANMPRARPDSVRPPGARADTIPTAVRAALLRDPGNPEWTRPAPPVSRLRFETSQGVFVLELHRDWGPIGVDRLYNLARLGYYDDTRFHRVRSGYIAQWGLHGDSAVNVAWSGRYLRDDPPRSRNARGTFAFSYEGPGREHTRNTQLYVNLADNPRNDAEPFTVLGTVVEGMAVLDSLYGGYGEESGSGVRQGRQGPLERGGNLFMDREYPKLDRIRRVTVVAR